MAIELKEGEAATYCDFRITAILDRDNNYSLKITTDLGNLIVLPQTNNSIVVESTKKENNG